MTYNARIDAFNSYELAIAALRETCIRKGQIQPDPDRPDELRWASEGYHGVRALDASTMARSAAA